MKIGAEEDAARIGAVDLIICCVKTYHLEESIPAIRQLLGADGYRISLQNGVDSEEKMGDAVGRDRVIGGAAYIESTIAAPGVISQKGGPRRVVLGELDGGFSERVRDIHRVFTRADIDCHISEDIRAELWRKFIFICLSAG